MNNSVFILHAGAEREAATRAAEYLRSFGIKTKLDVSDLSPGQSFVEFMSSALSEADYALLLWSAQAERAPWVSVEWEAALHRSVRERRSFLVVGRLEDVPLPAILAPRLSVDLFPQLDQGLDELVKMWRRDRAAEGAALRPVAELAHLTNDESGPQFYLTSSLFQIVAPIRLQRDVPILVLVENIIQSFKFPRNLEYEGRIGLLFSYSLIHNDTRLENEKSLADQAIEENSILWLEVAVRPFAQTQPESGILGTASFRSSELMPAEIARLLRHLIAEAGFGRLEP